MRIFVNKNKSDRVSNSTQEFNPQDEVEKVPERDEESKKTTSAKPKNKKQTRSVLSFCPPRHFFIKKNTEKLFI